MQGSPNALARERSRLLIADPGGKNDRSPTARRPSWLRLVAGGAVHARRLWWWCHWAVRRLGSGRPLRHLAQPDAGRELIRQVEELAPAGGADIARHDLARARLDEERA